MSVDAEAVRKIAHLARIAVKDDEIEHLQGELNAILAFVEQLREVDVTGVEPMTSVTPMNMKKRTDVVATAVTRKPFSRTRRRAKATISSCRKWSSDTAHITDLTTLTIAAAQDGLRRKEFTAVELADAHLAAIERARGLNAFVLETPDRAREMAKDAD